MGNRKLGFTLIELLVVITVLGILAGGVLVAINPLKRINQAKDTKVKSDIGQIANAMQAYYTFHQYYPATLQELQDSGDLKTIPLQPNTYTLTCTSDGNGHCTDVTISIALGAPQTAGASWQWSSITNQAGEAAVATATPAAPTPTPIPVASANDTPDFGTASLILDGVYAPEGTSWTDSRAVKLNTVNTSILTIDYGQTISVSRIKVQADCNDTYQVQYSANGSSWSNLYLLPTTTCPGLRTRDSGTFTSVTARYIRIYATGGDGAYSVSEVQAL